MANPSAEPNAVVLRIPPDPDDAGLVVRPISPGAGTIIGDIIITDGTDTVEVTVDGELLVASPTLLTELLVASGAMAMQVDDATVGTGTTYQGWAEPGTATSAALWRIRRIVETGDDDTDVSITFADGNRGFDNIWDDRDSLSYS